MSLLKLQHNGHLHKSFTTNYVHIKVQSERILSDTDLTELTQLNHWNEIKTNIVKVSRQIEPNIQFIHFLEPVKANFL